MKTKFDIGEEVFVRATVVAMEITSAGTVVDVKILDENGAGQEISLWEGDVFKKEKDG